MVGAIELGLGQELPSRGAISKRKILGTIHVATGRDDHLGGKITRISSKPMKMLRTMMSCMLRIKHRRYVFRRRV